MLDIDKFDRKILALWQRNTRQSAEHIGDKVGLSAAAVQRRLKKMREGGLIKAEVALLDASALGFPVTCVVGVDIERDSKHHIDQFKNIVLARPEVQQCYYVTGEVDFILIVISESLEAYNEFALAHLSEGNNVLRYVTYAVLDNIKGGGFLPLAD